MPDATIGQRGDTLITQLAGASYPWLDCDNGNAIAGANAQTFVPSASGRYALVIDLNGCVDTSACQDLVLTTITETKTNMYRLYPNPSQSLLQAAPLLPMTNKIIRS